MLTALFLCIVLLYAFQALVFLGRFARAPVAPQKQRRRGLLVNFAHCVSIAIMAGFIGHVIPRAPNTLVLGLVFSLGLVSTAVLLLNGGQREVPHLFRWFRWRSR